MEDEDKKDRKEIRKDLATATGMLQLELIKFEALYRIFILSLGVFAHNEEETGNLLPGEIAEAAAKIEEANGYFLEFFKCTGDIPHLLGIKPEDGDYPK